MTKRKTITIAEINAKKQKLETTIAESINRAKSGSRVSPAMDFLEEIKELIENAIKNNVSYRELSKNIYDVYSFKVSEQSIRAFAHANLGIPKRSKNTKKQAENTQKIEAKIPKNPAIADENDLV
jgi:uncharacterized protein YydD (DUF2326 family)